MSYKKLVEETLTKPRADRLWTANHYRLLPLSPQHFDMGGILPALLYMFRWGTRRGKGGFVATYGEQLAETAASATGKKAKITVTVEGIVDKLLQHSAAAEAEAGEGEFIGFSDPISKEILGDLYLAFCLENRRHKVGRQEPVQKVYATHFFASWIDLPEKSIDLRRVPEFIVSLLADGAEQDAQFPLPARIEENAMLRIFGRHSEIKGDKQGNFSADTFIESSADDIGIDELLLIRMAQRCQKAPLPLQGKERAIAVDRPLASGSAARLQQDLRIFIAAYGAVIPRQNFQRMVEAGIGLGLVNLLFSTFHLLACWKEGGALLPAAEQQGLPLFIDCSGGQDQELRNHSESITDDSQARYQRLPLLLMLLRVLEEYAMAERRLRQETRASQSDHAALLRLLGDLYHQRHLHAERVMDRIDEECLQLADELTKREELPHLCERLRSAENPALRLAEGLCELMGDVMQQQKYQSLLESAFMSSESHGLARKRSVQRTTGGQKKRIEVKSIVLSTELLEFLVHRYLYQPQSNRQAPLFLRSFIRTLQVDYGLYIDEAPPGYTISQQLLLRNKSWFERQLRDLGLLVGVNDAETMKRLRPRYVL